MRQAPTTRKVQIVYYFCGMHNSQWFIALGCLWFWRQFSFCFSLIVGMSVQVLILIVA